MPVFTIDELKALIQDKFPEAAGYTEITKLEQNYLEVRLPFRDQFLRPGGTISGPTLMTLADTAAYYVILAHIGPVLLAVTTSLNINFVRKPKPEAVVGSGTLLKLGKQLAVVDVRIKSEASDELVAQATVTYSIPPQR
ncbi:MAG TPA: PaaI family thioesterase [Polyangiales bacterium]|nr:PaaI family thioesterase [Polyangiales bacterium]